MLELFPSTDRSRTLLARVDAFLREHAEPREAAIHARRVDPATRWAIDPDVEALRERARAEGLWNLFLPDPVHGAGLTNLDYAPLAERMGRMPWSAELFNCNAPDTGNMELLLHAGSDAQKARWLRPLLEGRTRSAFAMTEPGVASSDPTTLETRIAPDRDGYRVDGRKWWCTGAMDPRLDFFIVMGVTDPEAPPHARHTMAIVPRATPGVTIVRPLGVYGFEDAPSGHAEVRFDGARIPGDHVLGGPGRGFELAQARLGPGRIHHCMRLVGLAQRALELAIERARTRVAFGKPLAAQGSVREGLAESACAIEQSRLLTLAAAAAVDRIGARAARDAIGMIKIVAPRMACAVIDRAIQLHGAAGLEGGTFLAEAFSIARALRIADGPDEVHLAALGKRLVEAPAR